MTARLWFRALFVRHKTATSPSSFPHAWNRGFQPSLGDLMGHIGRLHPLLVDTLRAFAGVTAFITSSLLVLEYGALTWGSRVSLAAISCGLVAGLVVRPLRARHLRRTTPVVRTAVHPAPDGTLWEQGSWDVHVGAMVPVHGYRVDVVDGRIVAAMVAEDGRSVELTLELPPTAS